jgi:hypothetical protein
MSIVFEKIEAKKWPVYTPDDILLGECNYLEMDDIRIQIVEQQLEGYYILFENYRKVFIDTYGLFDSHLDGLFDEDNKICTELVKAQSQAQLKIWNNEKLKKLENGI